MIRIKSRFFFTLFLILSSIGAWCLYDRVSFLLGAERAVATVMKIEPINSRCRTTGKHKHKPAWDCTRFKATLVFNTGSGRSIEVRDEAGTSRGHDRPVVEASYQVRHSFRVFYDPTDPTKYLLGRYRDLWDSSEVFLVLALCCLVGSFFDDRRRRRFR